MTFFEDVMLAQLTLSQTLPASKHLLLISPKSKVMGNNLPHAEQLKAVLARRDMKVAELAKSPVAASLPDGTLIVWVMLDFEKDTFALQVLVRKALQLLLDEHPKELAICVLGDDAQREKAAELALYVAWINGALLPVHKKKDEKKSLKRIELFGVPGESDFDSVRAQASGNVLCRTLTVLPPNQLSPTLYRHRIEKLADEQVWGMETLDMKALRKMWAGAFVAVAQGSEIEDAAIVHLTYRHPKAKKTIALVGKGICFDTGGHNLKPSRYMHNMHEDMNGSAVSLGILLAASKQKLPVNIDCWLALAQNHISPKAYKQNDIVKALNGTTIEVIHTDAEGRMVLADTLTLASRAKPDLMIDFATLTGSMVEAVGNRYSGVLGSDALLARAVSAGRETGERLCAFPMDEDYEAELESKFADIKQCTLEAGADHILATRFLQRFVEHDTPWLHVDLSAVRCEEGLGAVGTDVTGFGVAWGLKMLEIQE
jgi:leucyl aminopeptidase